MLKRILLILLNFFYIQFIFPKKFDVPVKAVCIVPVADLISQPFSSLNEKVDVKEEYKKIPISGEKGFLNCPRLHQLLFNEQVDIIEEFNEEVIIKISSVFAQTSDNKINCTYCTLKDNLLPLSKIDNHFLLPKQINFSETTFENPDSNITLILPFYDETTKKEYSIGTRFAAVGQGLNHFAIVIYDNKLNNFVQTKLDKKIAIQSLSYTKDEKIVNFVNLLKLWTQNDTHFIPYAWGGISLQHFVRNNNFALIKGNNCLGNEISFYKRSDLQNSPLTGFDCSNLISRAAQICQIPYFYKNTTTLEKNLKELTTNENIENGDLVWFPGHVLIIADIQKNIFIEARGYNSGYGKVHQIAINKFFKDINSFDEFKKAKFNNEPLNILNKAGTISLTINNYKILKLRSVWK